MIFSSITKTIGNTPVVKLSRMAPKNINLFVKCESCNPGGSVKDRMAMYAIEKARERNLLKPGQTVIEASSGNTGIGLGVVCAALGHPLVIVMAESFSVERRRLMRFLGAKVILTPPALKGTGMVAKATELAEKNGWFFTNQFENEFNSLAHKETTGEEILADFPPASKTHHLDYFVTGYGTGGTVNGVGSLFREKSPATKIIVSEPDVASVLTSGIPQPPPSADGLPASHPAFKPHPIQGWTTDFIPKLLEEAVAAKVIDEIKLVSGAAAMACCQRLTKEEGIFTGTSGGATLATALEVAKTAPAGSNILAMLPDTGERYLSTPLFQHIELDMNEEELATQGRRPQRSCLPSRPSASFDSQPTRQSAYLTVSRL